MAAVVVKATMDPALARARRDILEADERHLEEWRELVRAVDDALPNMEEPAREHYRQMNAHLARWIRQREEHIA